MADDKLDIVQEALNAANAVKNDTALPPNPATTGAALNMAANTMGSVDSPLSLADRGYKAGVSREAAEAYGNPVEQNIGPLQKLQQLLGHKVTPQGQPLAEDIHHKLVQDAEAAREAGLINDNDLQRARGARTRKFAEGGRVGYDEGGTVDLSANSTPNTPPGVNVFNPEGELVSIPHDTVQDAIGMGYRAAAPEEVHAYSQEQKYGTPGQQFKAGLEGVAQGLAGPLAPAAERAFGVDPEDIRGREEANPGTHGLGEAAGLVGGSFIPGAQGHLLGEAGEAVRAAMPLGKATFIGQVGPEAVKAAFETAFYQAGEEGSRIAKQDPTQNAESAIHNIGLAGVIGGVFGGPIGAALQKAKFAGLDLPAIAEPAFVSEMDRSALEAGDLATSVRHADNLKESEKELILGGILDRSEKAESPEIKAAAKRLNAPVLEGMISDNEWIQKAEDKLINGAPTYSGIRRQNLYKEAYNAGANAVEDALGDPSRYTKAELGDVMKSSITSQLDEQNAPIAAMYDELKKAHEVIPLAEKAAPAIARDIKEIQELKLSPSSPEGKIASRVMREIGNLKTVDDVKMYKSILSRSLSPTASSGEKRMVGILGDKLTDLEESSIERFAKKQASSSPEAAERIMELVGQRKEANAKYKDFIGKVKTLSEQLGKGRVYGLQDAKNFITERLTPEEIVQRLSSTKDSGFRKFFAKEYPEQHELMREFQKGALREKASATGTLSPKVLFNNVNKLEPEIQKSIFSASELQKLKDAETYLRSFPKDFNPSGTSHAMALRDFFDHPKGMIAANVRDYAMEKFIKGVAGSPDVSKAVKLARATIAGEALASKAINALFTKGTMPLAAIPVVASREKLSRLVDHFAANPDKMLQQGDNNPVPEYAQTFATTSVRAVQYLASLRPNTEPQAPLDRKREPNAIEKAKYNNALDIAQQPMFVLAKMQKGTLTPGDLEVLKNIYPSTYENLQRKIMSAVVDSKDASDPIPYQRRLQLSAFLGQPLDSSMTPQAILNSQMVLSSPQKDQSRSQSGTNSASPLSQSSVKGLSGLAKSAMTPGQARQAERSAGK